MRAILNNWIVEVHYKYKLVPETLFMAVHTMDRYLAARPGIARAKLQLVGIMSLLVASKYEEIYAPQVGAGQRQARRAARVP